MRLIKYEGLGNKFLVAIENDIPTNGSELAVLVCDPKTGFDADGLIFGTPSSSDGIDIHMTLFNADGSPAEISGNGIRCLAQEIFSHYGDKKSLQILTGSGVRTVTLGSTEGDEVEISVDMGSVRDGPELPLLDFLHHESIEIIRAATADIGNPHVVIELETLKGVDVAAAGSHIESLWEPAGINVHFLKARNKTQFSMLTWERGAGVTLACGTGASACAYVANKWGLVDEVVEALMPGGAAQIQLMNEKILLTGKSIRIAEFEVPTNGQ
tara:strand:+ start:173 stop:982 length:810 start_codon:yes stop_codon:yes gene_type:complete